MDNQGETIQGRPSKYDPAYCQQLVEVMSQGYSLTAFASQIEVSRSTIGVWAQKHDDFSQAIGKGKAACAFWWETALRNAALTGRGNVTAAIFGLKNMAPDEWRDKQAVEHHQSIPSLRVEIIEPQSQPKFGVADL